MAKSSPEKSPDRDCDQGRLVDSILDGYLNEQQFAINADVSTRTVQRYRHQPDGLPYVMWGGKVLIPIEESRDWLKSRIKRPNSRRRRAG
jgi:hypothetical protein